MRNKVITIIFLLITSGALAHDHERPQLNDWYKGLKASGILCCDGTEAKHLSDVEWRNNAGHYEVFLEKEWVGVPDSAVIKGPNLDGRTLVWPWYRDGHPFVRCFMPGIMT